MKHQSIIKHLITRTPHLMLTVMLIALLHSTVAVARTPIRQWFTAMPDSVMPLLTKNNRLDFIDFVDCGMTAIVTNRLDGKSRMDTLTDDYLLVSYTSSCEVAMKLLPVNDSTDVLCMVTTALATVPDSHIAFYDAHWQPLPTRKYIEEPKLDDFAPSCADDSARIAWSKVTLSSRTYHLSEEDNRLVCRLSALRHLNKTDHEALTPYLQSDTLVLRWHNGHYER